MNAEPANILLIIADSLRTDGFGCHSAPVSLTPHVDRPVATGVRIDGVHVAWKALLYRHGARAKSSGL